MKNITWTWYIYT